MCSTRCPRASRRRSSDGSTTSPPRGWPRLWTGCAPAASSTPPAGSPTPAGHQGADRGPHRRPRRAGYDSLDPCELDQLIADLEPISATLDAAGYAKPSARSKSASGADRPGIPSDCLTLWSGAGKIPSMSLESDDLGEAEGQPSRQRWRYLDDPVAIRALAHPLRHDLMGIIGRLGRATTALAAQELGISHGLASHHLRQLAKYGFVEQVAGKDNRERPWRLVATSYSWTGATGSPEGTAAVDVVEQVYAEQVLERFLGWQQRRAAGRRRGGKRGPGQLHRLPDPGRARRNSPPRWTRCCCGTQRNGRWMTWPPGRRARCQLTSPSS